MKPRIRALRSLCIAVAVTVMGDVVAEPFSAAEIEGFAERMSSRHQYRAADVKGILAEARVLEDVLEAIARPAERKPWYEYREIFIKPVRIERGVDFMSAHRRVLERAEEVYGVPVEIVVAIIGVETLYGEHTGRHRVLDSLATLGFRYPRRSEFFSSELEHFLLLVREEGLDPRLIKGSYAGAMGLPQFISSSYRSYAVDFDRDETRNLLDSVDDAIGSVGNYLMRHGWRRGEPIAFPVRVEGDGYQGLVQRGMKPSVTIGEMRRSGVEIYAPLPDAEQAALLEFELRDGFEHWLALDNFYVITRYNHSALYAMAVFQLAQEIKSVSQGLHD